MEMQIPNRFLDKCNKENTFSPIYLVLQGYFLKNKILRERIEEGINSFKLHEKLLLYDVKIFVRRKNIKDTFYFAQ